MSCKSGEPLMKSRVKFDKNPKSTKSSPQMMSWFCSYNTMHVWKSLDDILIDQIKTTKIVMEDPFHPA
ncbi:hypothetical protein M9H77_10209 [Catharanthus roseus]|uniref:Uncharacterized protein n=1 Tax=Catharanthus roseus TaxID=4058 RepID=A0ACC0C360_CATRO|nr:hypothetical protein M9H77_10209 [Catharanthus roseus]